jgi:hypothetical protein
MLGRAESYLEGADFVGGFEVADIVGGSEGALG